MMMMMMIMLRCLVVHTHQNDDDDDDDGDDDDDDDDYVEVLGCPNTPKSMLRVKPTAGMIGCTPIGTTCISENWAKRHFFNATFNLTNRAK